MENETRYQRVAREQAGRQAIRKAKMEVEQKAKSRAIRKANKITKETRREQAYSDWATSDFPNQEGN